MRTLILALQNWILVYFWGLNTIYFLLISSSFIYIFFCTRRIESGRMELFLKSEGLPTLGIIVPAYNEAGGIVFSVQSILNLQYSNKTIIVVNDGSTDDSMHILKTTFQLRHVHRAYIEQIKTKQVLEYYHSLLHPNLIVIDKLNGGKSDAINVGINACTSDYILTIDADTIIDNFELSRMLRFMATRPHIQAFGASVRVANGCEIKPQGITKIAFPTSYLGGVQAVEYLRAFYLGRMGWEPLQGSLIISGAFTLFKTESLKQLNGYATDMLGEDMEIVVRFKKEQYQNKQSPQTGFIAEPVCWTEVPENLKVLGSQRSRWQVGVIQALWTHRSLLFNPKYGITGLFTYPYFFFGEMLSPIVECLGYLVILSSLILQISSVSFILSFITITLGLTFLLNVLCSLIEILFFRKYFKFSHIWKMVLFSFLENIGYRQLTVYWRLRGFFRVFKKTTGWKDMKKAGF